MNAGRSVLLVLKIAALAVALTAINGIGSRFLPASVASGGGDAAPTGAPSGLFLATVLGLMLLQTVALAYPVQLARWRGWRLVLAVFLLHFGTVTFLSQIETLVYLGNRLGERLVGGLFAMGLFSAAVFSPLLILVLGRWGSAGTRTPRSPRHLPVAAGEWAWKTAVGGLVYVALYYLFGYYVAWKNPLVRQFYGGTDPGTLLAQMKSLAEATPWMLPLQYARGLLWVGLAVLAMRMMRGSWWRIGLAVSMLFTVPAFYLLMPNPLMPGEVRLAHLVETAPYQFLFGWFVVWLFRRDALRTLPPSDRHD